MNLRAHLLAGQVIPAHPLALDSRRRLSERHQRALTRYYIAAGAGGVAVGVHSTQFEIREPQHALLAPVLELASRTVDEELQKQPRPFVKIAGLCGLADQAMQEAALAVSLGYHAGLLSLGAWKSQPEPAMLEHCQRIAGVIPVVGFYLQPAVGGRIFSRDFWRKLVRIENVVGIKIAPFNRYQTLDVLHAVADSGRDDVALYTGNDDTIVMDLLTPYRLGGRTLRMVGGLLGHWGVWTRKAVEMLEALRVLPDDTVPRSWLQTAAAVTDMNAALFDPAHEFAGCLPGILEVLRRQGLVPTANCLDPRLALSPGQSEEITRVTKAHPELVDDEFVAANRDRWLNDG